MTTTIRDRKPIISQGGVRNSITCCVCGVAGPAHVFVIGHNNFSESGIYRCFACDSHFTYPLPDQDLLKDFYSSRFANPRGPRVLSRSASHVDTVCAHFGETDRESVTVLDYGFGRGNTLCKLAARRFRCHGFDLSLPESDSKLGKRTVALFNDTAHLGSQYDAIICSHVLEHLSAPRDSLAMLADRLRVGGLFILEIPNESEVVIRSKILRGSLEGHLSFFNPSYLEVLLGEMGLRILEKLYAGPPVPVDTQGLLWEHFGYSWKRYSKLKRSLGDKSKIFLYKVSWECIYVLECLRIRPRLKKSQENFHKDICYLLTKM